jgi:hypothetical protein
MRSRAPIDRSPLARSLERCAAICTETLTAYLDPAAAQTSEFGQALLAAVAAMQTAKVHERSAPQEHDAPLRVASSLCRAAAADCRHHGLDEQLLRAAGAFERAATICE